VGQQRAQIVLGGHEQGWMHGPGAFPPQANLGARFFTGHNQGRRTAAGGVAASDLEEQGRLADAWLARQECHRSWYQAAAEHPVKLPDAGGLRPGSLRVMIADRLGWTADRPWTDRPHGRSDATFDQRAPRLTSQRPTQRTLSPALDSER
jgi:hypothetical protein